MLIHNIELDHELVIRSGRYNIKRGFFAYKPNVILFDRVVPGMNIFSFNI